MDAPPIADIGAAWETRSMFAFDEWADWLRSEAEKCQNPGLVCRYSDNRNSPKFASNPSIAVEMETAERIGSLRFWKQGTYDYVVFDIASGVETANEAGVEANDQTVAPTFVRFHSLFGDGHA